MVVCFGLLPGALAEDVDTAEYLRWNIGAGTGASSGVNADDAWEVATGEGIVVAVLDTGVDFGHADLVGAAAGSCAQLDAINNDADATDDHGHGTFLASLVAARQNDVGVVGVAPDADILAIKALDSANSGTGQSVSAGIDHAVGCGADVILITAYQSAEDADVATALAAAEAADIVVIAAAGNDASSVTSFPSSVGSVFSVGAVDADGEVLATSNTGGVDAYSVGAFSSSVGVEGASIASVSSTGYAYAAGTSMAAAHVAGVAALIRQAFPNFSAQQVRERLVSTGLPLPNSSAAIRVHAGQAVHSDLAERDLVFHEIMWAGSDASTADEWLEIANTTTRDIDLSGFQITRLASGTETLMLELPQNAAVAAGGVYWASNYAPTEEKSTLAVTADFVENDISLANTKLQLKLYSGDFEDSESILLDTADDGVGSPLAGSSGTGTRASMRRVDAAIAGTEKDAWETATMSEGFDESALEMGTPGVY